MLRVAAIQMRMSEAREDNLTRAEAAVREAAANGARLVVLPELFETPYFPQVEDEGAFALAHDLAASRAWRDDPTQDSTWIGRFRRLARELAIVLPLSVFEREAQSYYNSLVFIDSQGLIERVYRKAHIPDGPCYEEKFYFAPGNTALEPWPTQVGVLGCGICWDQWFPECARILVLKGAEVLVYPTAIGTEPPEAGALDTRGMWRAAMVGHAVCNGVPVVAANRVGDEGSMTFYGNSFICDPTGQLLARADTPHETVLLADLDLKHWRKHRAAMGFFRDRRPELYTALTTREGRS